METIIRVVRNTMPVGGEFRCEEGYWKEDTLRGKRRTFVVLRTIRVGTKSLCEEARQQESVDRQDRPRY